MIAKESFESLTHRVLAERGAGENFYFTLAGEDTQYIRFNGSRVRQIGNVQDAHLGITLVLERPDGLRRVSRSVTITGLSWQDEERVSALLAELRAEIGGVPLDPYATLPKNNGSGESVRSGKLLPREDAVSALLTPTVRSMDLAGIYASGKIVRALSNSAGQFQWFSTETASFDYSIYTPNQRALKGTFGTQEWSAESFEKQMQEAKSRLPILERPVKSVRLGKHRTYLAPAAVHDLIGMLSWGCIGEGAIRRGESPLCRVRSGERKFSPIFNLSEDFGGGEVPRFNELGELAPETMPLIAEGELVHSLVSTRTSKEYQVDSNGASESESLRSPSVDSGILAEEKILRALDTGLYLSNLHYLNWSDQPAGRVTGMTRYACFWVEDGEIQAPIENLRWDDSIFHLLGSELEALTHRREYLPATSTYYRRELGGMWVPGALLRAMDFTL